MEKRLAKAMAWMSGRQPIPQRPHSSRVVLSKDPGAVEVTEFGDIVAGRVVVAHDAAEHAQRNALMLSVDGGRYRRLRGEARTLAGSLLSNGDFRRGLASWVLENRASGIRAGIDITPEWTLEDGHTAFVSMNSKAATMPTLVYVGDRQDEAIPVVAGRDYVVSALVGAHRCEVQFRVELLSAEREILATFMDTIPTETRGGRHRADYHHTRLAVRAPDGAVAARLSITKGTSAAGEQDSFLFLADVRFGWEGESLPPFVLTPERTELVRRWLRPSLLSVSLPSVVLDGQVHLIEMRDVASGDAIGGPIEIEQAQRYEGAIEHIEGAVVSGWARNATEPTFVTALQLELDGVPVGDAEGQLDVDEGRQAYRLVMPRKLLDGKAHHVAVRAIPDGAVVAEVGTILSGQDHRSRSVHFDAGSTAHTKSAVELKQALGESEKARFTLAHQLEEQIALATALGSSAKTADEQTASRDGAASLGHRRPRAAVIAWDVGHNPVGRAFVLYELIKDVYDVDVIGPNWERYGDGIWPYAQAPGANVISWKCRDLSDFVPQAMLHATWTKYDVVYVSKPRLPSLFLGLLIKEHSGCPLVLDIDDEELTFVGGGEPIELETLLAGGPEALLEPYEELATRYANSLARHADAITVSNVALERRYGGHVVRHARNHADFVIDEATRQASRRDLGIADDEFALMWAGTPRGHKGLVDVARVLQEMDDPGFSLHVIGDFPDKSLVKELESFDRARIRLHGRREFSEIPAIIAASDVVPLLQDPEHPIAHFQFPAKLTDAIALGKPVLATRVDPIEDVLPSEAVTEVTTENLAAALIEARAKASPERAQRIREYFLGEFSDTVNRARAHLAIEAARADVRPLPPDFEELKALLVRESGAILRRHQAAIVGHAVVSAGADPVGRPQAPDLAVFWKQNDTGLYGRRTEMIVKYLLETGRVGKVMYFDAPLSLTHIDSFRERAQDRTRGEFGLLLRNSIMRWMGLLDQGSHMQRLYVHGIRPDDQFLGQTLPGREGYAAYVASQLDEAGFDPSNTVAWVCPVAWQFPEVRDAYPFERVVVDLIDDQRAWPIDPNYRARLQASYSQTLALADLVTTNCQPVADAFASEVSQIHVIPNGTESYSGRDATLPRRLKGLPRPIVGYVGNMRDRIDWSLLNEVVARRPDWTFVLAGPTDGRAEAAEMKTRPNVIMPGAVEYYELASYLLNFDAAIVPHDRSPLTETMNPLKIYNYLAAGLPVVATGIPNIDEVAEFIEFASDADSFIEALQRAIDTPRGTLRPELAAVLSSVEWTARVETIADLLDAELGQEDRHAGRSRSAALSEAAG